MTRTVPIASPTCDDLSFKYDHNVDDEDEEGLQSTDCEVFFRDGEDAKDNHNLTLGVPDTPGCRSYSSMLEFEPYNKPGSQNTLWHGYSPSNITVRMIINGSLMNYSKRVNFIKYIKSESFKFSIPARGIPFL